MCVPSECDGTCLGTNVHRPARRILLRAVLAAPVVAFLVGGWSYRSIADDGFIYLRIVQQTWPSFQ